MCRAAGGEACFCALHRPQSPQVPRGGLLHSSLLLLGQAVIPYCDIGAAAGTGTLSIGRGPSQTIIFFKDTKKKDMIAH